MVGRESQRIIARWRMPEGLWALAAAGVLIILMRLFVVRPFAISSGSMQPTLDRGDLVLVNEFIYHVHPPRRGDVILFRYPQDERWGFVKRVVGLPGDVVAVRDGELWVNGAPVAELSAIPASGSDAPAPKPEVLHIPSSRLFVLGDNRGSSLDSRSWGTVDEHNVMGKAFLVYWSHRDHWWDIRWRRIGQWVP